MAGEVHHGTSADVPLLEIPDLKYGITIPTALTLHTAGVTFSDCFHRQNQDRRIKTLIDLHTHSTASDGKLTPAQLVREAAVVGVTVLALTDHDTLSGLSEAAAEAEKAGITFIPGVEISAEYGPGSMHMLGYFVDPDSRELGERLGEMREGRDGRNRRILDKLDRLGMPIDREDLARMATGESMGRPHIANAMVAMGYVTDFNAAFDEYLGRGKPAYVDRPRMSPADSIRTIHSAGGLAVLAHPQTLDLTEGQLRDLLRELAGAGLDGVEVYYYSHSSEETELYCALAAQYGLLTTGGTDYHGPDMVKTALGVGKGDLSVPAQVAEALLAARPRV